MRVWLGVVLCLPSMAWAVPAAVTHQGRLLDASGAPVEVSTTVRVSLWDAASGGAEKWAGTATVTPEDGYFALALGAPPMPTLDTALLDAGALYVQVEANSVAMPRTALTSAPYALVAGSLDLDVVQLDDPRLLWSSAITPHTTCTTGWCDYGNQWGVNRLSTKGYYNACTGANCATDYVDVVLNNNQHRSVLMSHLDWTNTASFDVLLSLDGGATWGLHKRVEAYRFAAQPVVTSQIRTLITNLPLGQNVRVRVRGARGRVHIDGFALSRNLYPEDVSGRGCPVGTVQVTGYCIQPETTAAFGQTWTAAQDSCHSAGLRLCSVEEVNTAIRHGALKTYASATRNAWYITGTLAENSPGESGYGENCQVQGNTDEAGHPLYSVQCSHPLQDTSSYRTTICCW